jgi:hypothetical protein
VADDRAHSSGEPSDPPTQSELAQTPAPSTSPQSTGRGSLVVGDDIVRSATPWINSTGAKIAAVVGAGLFGGLVALGVTGGIPNPFNGKGSDRVGSVPDVAARTPIDTVDADTFYLDYDATRNIGYTDDERIGWCSGELKPIEGETYGRVQLLLEARAIAKLTAHEPPSEQQSAQGVVYVDRTVILAAALWGDALIHGEKLIACTVDNNHPQLGRIRGDIQNAHSSSPPADRLTLLPQILSVLGNASVYQTTGQFVEDASPVSVDQESGLPVRVATIKNGETEVKIQETMAFIGDSRWVAQSYIERNDPGWDTDLLTGP